MGQNAVASAGPKLVGEVLSKVPDIRPVAICYAKMHWEKQQHIKKEEERNSMAKTVKKSNHKGKDKATTFYGPQSLPYGRNHAKSSYIGLGLSAGSFSKAPAV